MLGEDKTKPKGFINAPQKRTFTLDSSEPVKVPIGALEKLKELEKAQQDFAEAKEDKREAPTQPPVSEEGKDSKEEDPDKDTQISGLTTDAQQIYNELMSAEQEIAAEKSSSPIDFDDVIKYNEFRQSVTISPFLRVVFRTITSEESLEIYKRVGDETEKTIAYITDLGVLYNLTCSIKEMNGSTLPNHVPGGKFDAKLFEKKFEIVSRLPSQITAVLSIHNMWFDRRVRKMFLFKKDGKSDITESLKKA